MRTYTFNHTNADGSRRVEVIEAENLTQALAIYRARLKEHA
jgi:hypothetical protein